jgi:hypothetical protein
MFRETSSDWSPWHVIPADHKWFSRVAVADILVKHLESLKLRYPKLDAKEEAGLAKAKKALEEE